MAVVIDDNRRVRQLVGEILHRAGVQPVLLPDAEEALAYLQREAADVLFTDLRLPGRDGMSALIEARRLYPGLPCVVMTGFASVESSVEALRLGARDYVFKPITPQKILSALHRALQPEEDHCEPKAVAPPADPAAHRPGSGPASQADVVTIPLQGDLRAMNRFLVREVILRCDGNKAAAARTLGMHRRSLYRLLQEDDREAGTVDESTLRG